MDHPDDAEPVRTYLGHLYGETLRYAAPATRPMPKNRPSSTI